MSKNPASRQRPAGAFSSNRSDSSTRGGARRTPSGTSRSQRESGYSGQARSQGQSGYAGQFRPQRDAGYSGQSRPQGQSGYSEQSRPQRETGHSGQSRPQREAGHPGQSRSQREAGHSGQSRSQSQGRYEPAAQPRVPRAVIRIDQVQRVLGEILQWTYPADATLSHWFRAHPSLGGRDRGEVAEAVYDVLRHLRRYRQLAASGSGPASRRLAILGLTATLGAAFV